MDRFKKLNGGVKTAAIAALVLVMTGALVLLAAEKTTAAKSERGFLGVTVSGLDEGEREDLGVKHGIKVNAVEKESAAAKAGILEEDVIQSVNGEKVRSPLGLTEIIRDLKPGAEARIGLWRKGKALEVKAVLGAYERPKRFAWHMGPWSKVVRSRAFLGVSIMDLDDGDLASYFSVKAGEGILVSGVQKGTPAEKAGIKSGDVIVQVGKMAVKKSGDVQEALAELKEGDSVEVTVMRRGKKAILKAEPDFNRHRRILRVFEGDGDYDIERLELPDIDIEIPELPPMPEIPDCADILQKVHEKLDGVKVKLDRRLKRVVEDLWI
ncbi:MAG: PDZ domain-containing protein [Candidatus Aminicenantes bacterium]|nr:PDZ domain-containing protein [Candidatus Aminicenantes bacterium]